MKLTDTLLRSLKASGQVQKKADGGGLPHWREALADDRVGGLFGSGQATKPSKLFVRKT